MCTHHQFYQFYLEVFSRRVPFSPWSLSPANGLLNLCAFSHLTLHGFNFPDLSQTGGNWIGVASLCRPSTFPPLVVFPLQWDQTHTAMYGLQQLRWASLLLHPQHLFSLQPIFLQSPMASFWDTGFLLSSRLFSRQPSLSRSNSFHSTGSLHSISTEQFILLQRPSIPLPCFIILPCLCWMPACPTRL